MAILITGGTKGIGLAIGRRSAEANPSGRNVTDDDDCSLVEYLASPSAAMIQGQVVFVTGGSYLAA
jgi:enoyl-[acyl-carrier protein] reductase III